MLNVNFDYPKTELDLCEIFNLKDANNDIDWELVQDNLKQILGKENYETFFKITSVPEPKSLNDYLELTNNLKWSIQADWRNPFIGISSLKSGDTIPVVDENPQICKFILDKVALKDPVALKHMRASGISKKDMNADYDIFKIESYYTFIELVSDNIRNSTLRDTFANAIKREQNVVQQQTKKTHSI